MSFQKYFVGFRREDAAGFDDLSVSPTPPVPQPRETEGSPVAHAKVEGLLPAAARPLPFIRAVRGDDAPASPEGLAEGRLLRGRFAARVDEPGAHGIVLGPGRDQSPLEQYRLTLVTCLPHRQDI